MGLIRRPAMFKRYGLFRRLFPFLGPYKGRYAIYVGLTAVAALIGLFEPWPLAFLLDSIIDQKSAFPSWLGFARDWGVTGQILMAVLLGFGLTVIGQGITVLLRAIDTRLELGIVLDFRSKLFLHVQQLSFQYHDQRTSSQYIYLVNNLAHNAGALLTAFVPLAQAFITLVGMFIVVYLLAPQIAIAAILVVPIVYYVTTLYGRVIEPRLIAVREMEGESLRIVHEKMMILRIVVAFCREHYEHARFRKQATEALDARVRITIMQTAFSLGVALVTAAGTAVVLFMSARAVIAEEISVGELTVILAYVAAVYQPLEQISRSLTDIQQQLILVDLVFKTLDEVPDVQEEPDAISLRQPFGRVTLENVTFHYDDRPQTISDLSLEIRAGEFVAVVGPTGAGKSTLVSLIPRFFDPQEGRVLMDGQDVRDLTIESVRGAVSLVQQEPVLFIGTLADNIRYGRLDATDEEIIAAAQAANCHDFIMGLPDGYETTVGERGARISGGERQRIAVARAFLKDAPILILDEPTSSIDSSTERVILDALERLAEGRTTIMIAHRLSTIRKADRILVINEGRLAEEGTHADLLARNGIYASLWWSQFGESGPPDAPPSAGTPALPTGGGGGTPGTLALPPAPTQPAAPDPAGTPALSLVTGGAPAPVESVRRPKVVVLGMMTKIPVAGVVWQTVHYLVGLERLGVEVYYVEAHARTPSMFMEREQDDGSAKAAAFIADVFHRFGLDGRWAFHALHDDGAVYGMSKQELQRLYAEADVIINLHGGTEPLPEHSATGRLVYIETDPVQLQIELYEQDPVTIKFLEPHVAFFTFGENYGRPDCGLPVSDRFRFLPTRQPVVRDFWEPYGHGPAQAFTTIGNWRQPWREVRFKGETYHWTKHLEFLKFLEAPRRTGQRFELALSSYTDDDRGMLEEHGWHIAHALDFSIGLDSYRSYVSGSRGEFTVAKDQNVRLRTGWFSDRSATYLAAGRPVVTQDTGFGNVLPIGEGLFAFSTMEDIVDAMARINSDYDRHRRAARAIAREFFDHDAVLRPLLTEVGVPLARRRTTPPDWDRPTDAFAPDLDLSVVRRRPTTLAPTTVSAVLGAPTPHVLSELTATTPTASIVVVTHDNLVFTRLCLESLIANTGRSDVEIIVVDNASADMTPGYLEGLAAQSPRFRVLRNEHNLGFAAAVNQGLARARGDVLVVLNNDTMVAPGWLDRLERHLADPSVGMVGPLTNACPNEARIDVPYTTYGGFLDFAAQHADRHDGESFVINVLTMFCVAFRRAVFDLVGPLDERFEVGMFEDDDYALRLQGMGLRLTCADDVVVHHFGEASFGKLVPSGEHGRLFNANKERFERKWNRSWETHRSRPSETYVELVADVRAAIAGAVQPGATVLVVSKGDDELLDVPGRQVWHFPRTDSGEYTGWYPESAADVLAHLEDQIAKGARYIVFPQPASWWLEFYEGLAERLASEFDEVDGGNVCRIFAARESVRVVESVEP